MRTVRFTLAMIWLYAISLLLAAQLIAPSPDLDQYTRVQFIFVFLGMGIGNFIIILIGYGVMTFLLPARKAALADTKTEAKQKQGGQDFTTHPSSKDEVKIEPYRQMSGRLYEREPFLGQISNEHDIIECIRPYSDEAVNELDAIINRDQALSYIITKAAEISRRISESQAIKQLSYIETREDGSLKNLSDYNTGYLSEKYTIASKYDPTNKCDIHTIIDESNMPMVSALYRTREAACLSLVAKFLEKKVSG